VDEFTTIAERWLYYSDGRDLYPYCPPCAKREFADHARNSGNESGTNLAELMRGLPPVVLIALLVVVLYVLFQVFDLGLDREPGA